MDLLHCRKCNKKTNHKIVSEQLESETWKCLKCKNKQVYIMGKEW
jgi:ribosomal protein L37AE/L43A